jgi:membrane-associated phospholipid phosphatase
LIAAAVLAAAPALCAEEASPPAPRPIFSSTLRLLGDYGLSPFKLRGADLGYAAVLGAVAIGLHQADVPVQKALSTGDARKPWLDDSMPLASDLGEGWVDALAAGTLWALGDERLSDTSVRALQAMAVAGVYNQALKYALWSNRPYDDLTAHEYFQYGKGGRGMPSGHAFSVFAAAEVYGAEYGRFWTYPFALLVSYSRIYNQAHWLSDVYVGAVLGIIAGRQSDEAARELGQPRWRVGPAAGRENALAISTRF